MNLNAQSLGKLGGLKILSIKGKDYFKELGRKGGLAKSKKLLGFYDIWDGNWAKICPNHKDKFQECWKEHPGWQK